MRLTDEERAMLAGEAGPGRQWAIEHQMRVGRYLGADDFVPVSQAHIMADTESLGVAGVEWLERLAALPERERRVRIPTITDPRGTDLPRQRVEASGLDAGAGTTRHRRLQVSGRADDRHLHQLPDDHAGGARRAHGVWRHRRGDLREQRAWRALQLRRRSVGAGCRPDRPHASLRLPSDRRAASDAEAAHRATRRAHCTNGVRLVASSVGIAGDYWQVPALVGVDRVPTSDELKHFGAALASYGSVALFHMVGVTPEAEPRRSIRRLRSLRRSPRRISPRSSRAYRADLDEIDVVVFSSPQLSLIELRELADLLDGRRAMIPLLVVTSPQVKPDADRLGITARIEAAGGLVLSGMCFYQSYAREMAEANGWQTLATQSAKLVNILGGYGYRPALLSMQECVEAACTGRIAR